MSERENAGRGLHPAPGVNITATQQEPASTPASRAKRSAQHRLPVVNAIAVPPLGRRRMWLLLVDSCPWCRLAHVHRAASSHGGRRYGCCGRPYHVRVLRAQGRSAA